MHRTFAVSIIAILIASTSAAAAPIQPNPTSLNKPSLVVRIVDGCGPGRWRGPYGGCRGTPYYGRPAAGYYQSNGDGCPVGFWRGPWGRCRNTPYHGRLPNGAWN